MNPEKPDVSIVMPCLNEAGTVGEVVDRAREAAALFASELGLGAEIVVADNGSTDGSQELARSRGARVVDVAERGYGAALMGGFAAAEGRYLIMGDSDCSYDFVESVPMVRKLVAGADLCMGSRFDGEIKPGAMPWKNRYIGNPVLSFVLRLFYRTRVSDAHCGMRALTRECYQRLGLTAPGMDFASEMVLKAAIFGQEIAEVPVTLWPDKRGRPPHLRPWRDGWRHLRLMLMLSPAWLFFIPGLFLGLLGLALFAILLAQPSGTMVQVGPFRFGDHFLAISSALVVIGSQLLLFGTVAMVHALTTGIRPMTAALGRFVGWFRLEYVMILGALLSLLGLLVIALITFGWILEERGVLNELREMIAGATLIIVGVQTFFAGFLVAIIGGVRSRLAIG